MRESAVLAIGLASLVLHVSCASTARSLPGSDLDASTTSCRVQSPWPTPHLPSQSVFLAIGNTHQCALMADESVRCRGANNTGEVGTGDLNFRDSPVVVPGLGEIVQVAVSIDGTTCAMDRGGGIWCWGSNRNGELGNGHSDDESCGDSGGHPIPCRLRPTRVTGIPRASRLVVGENTVCIAGVDHSVWCWGSYLLSGSWVVHPTPFRIGLYPDLADLLLPRDIPAVVREDGRVETNAPGAPEQIPPGARLYTNVTGTYCLLLADRSVQCMGDNSLGMVGTGSTSPVPPSRLYNLGLNCIADISMGRYHVCALSTDGRAYCWGENHRGQTGQAIGESAMCSGPGSTVDCSPTPTLVAGVRGIRSLFVGAFTSCAIRADSSVWCWGSNLGDWSATPRHIRW